MKEYIFFGLLMVTLFAFIKPANAFDKRWENNNAMREYCPGWCCPAPYFLGDDMPKTTIEYCLNHPHATEPPEWMKYVIETDKKMMANWLSGGY